MWNRTGLNFPHSQGPVARRELRPATQILRAGNILLSPRGNPCNGGSRGRAAWRREALPNRRLRPPPGAFLVTFWASKKSLAAGAAKLPCKERNFSIIAPSSVTASPCHLPPRGKALRGRPPHPPPSGAPSPQGEGFAGEAPSSAPFGGTFPPGGRLCGGGPRGTFPRWEGLKNETGAPGRPFSRGRLIALIGDTSCWSDTGARR